MKEFTELLAITDTLFGPQGCPWDREQTMTSARACIVEEAAELLDAIEKQDNDLIKEELGDLFFVAFFFCKLAEREERCTVQEVLQELNAKLIRRHPHVFGEAKIDTVDELLIQWNVIKQQEKGKTERKSALDSLPNSLSSLAKAEKMIKKLKKTSFTKQPPSPPVPDFTTEAELGELLFAITAKAQAKGLEAEHALRKILVETEISFRQFESQTGERL